MKTVIYLFLVLMFIVMKTLMAILRKVGQDWYFLCLKSICVSLKSQKLGLFSLFHVNYLQGKKVVPWGCFDSMGKAYVFNL